jgi:hypothetical protein
MKGGNTLPEYQNIWKEIKKGKVISYGGSGIGHDF